MLFYFFPQYGRCCVAAFLALQIQLQLSKRPLRGSGLVNPAGFKFGKHRHEYAGSNCNGQVLLIQPHHHSETEAVFSLNVLQPAQKMSPVSWSPARQTGCSRGANRSSVQILHEDSDLYALAPPLLVH